MAQSSKTSSSTLSISGLVQLRNGVFSGQSPALPHRPLPSLQTSSTQDWTALETRLRYRQDEEESLRGQILSAEISIGTDLAQTLNKLYKLGIVLIDQGRYKQAEGVIRRLVDTYNHQHNTVDNEVYAVNALELLSGVLRRQGLYLESQRLYQDTLRRRKRLLGPEHLDTLTSFNNLGVALLYQGKLVEAEASFQHAREGRTKVLGPEHPDTLGSISNLGIVQATMRKYAEAEKYSCRPKRIRCSHLSRSSRYICPSRQSLGVWLCPSLDGYSTL